MSEVSVAFSCSGDTFTSAAASEGPDVYLRAGVSAYLRAGVSARWDAGAKFAIDLAVASIALLILLPLLVIIAAAVSLDGGPVFYKQDRVGLGGRLFTCLKFRSMVVNNGDILDMFLSANPADAAVWATNRKLRKDPRVTRVGSFIRKTSLDELPQLFNVLRMEMSLVGPRPILPDEVALYGEELVKYQNFRPGLTGLWQISGRSETTFMDRVRYDSIYAETWSFRNDLIIIGRTFPVVLGRSGAC